LHLSIIDALTIDGVFTDNAKTDGLYFSSSGFGAMGISGYIHHIGEIYCVISLPLGCAGIKCNLLNTDDRDFRSLHFGFYLPSSISEAFLA